jgi:hypothetical protein
MRYRFLRFVTTLIIGFCVGLLMHLMGVPMPNIGDLWHGLGLSKLARAFS